MTHAREPQSDEATCPGERARGSPIDARVLQGILDLGGEADPGLLGELIALYVEDAESRLSEIARSHSECDLVALERAAHALKSSSLNIGALRLGELCRSLERDARSGRTETLSTLVHEATRHFPEVREALRALPT